MDSTDWYLSEHNQSPTFKPTLATYKPTGYRNRMNNNLQIGGPNKVNLPGPTEWKKWTEYWEEKWHKDAQTLRSIKNSREKNPADIEKYTKQVEIGKLEEHRARILLTLNGGKEKLQKEMEETLLEEQSEIEAKIKNLKDGEDAGEAEVAHDKKDDGKKGKKVPK